MHACLACLSECAPAFMRARGFVFVVVVVVAIVFVAHVCFCLRCAAAAAAAAVVVVVVNVAVVVVNVFPRGRYTVTFLNDVEGTVFAHISNNDYELMVACFVLCPLYVLPVALAALITRELKKVEKYHWTARLLMYARCAQRTQTKPTHAMTRTHSRERASEPSKRLFAIDSIVDR